MLERFEQFGETLWGVVGVESVRYNGKRLGQRAKLAEVVKGLTEGKARREELKAVVVDYLGEGAEPLPEGWLGWEELKRVGDGLKKEEEELRFYQGSFSHPLWVLFSSGTTGKVRKDGLRVKRRLELTRAHTSQPKPIVHGAGGMLIQSKKEHFIHGDMSSDDVFFYYTTPGKLLFHPSFCRSSRR